MQRISFTTSAGTIEIDDVNCSSLNGEHIFRLNDFDPNSAKTRVEGVQCIGLPGQKVLSSVVDVKTVTAKISFAPVYYRNNKFINTGTAGMYALRREVMKRFPINVTGTLTYTNDSGTYTIRARIDEIPVVTMFDGFLCQCTIMFTCDYPYWCKAITSEEQTINGGGSAIFTPPEYGDIASPIGGIITCTQDLSGADGLYYRISNVDSRSNQVNFCNYMRAGYTYSFNFLYNNEWTVPGDVYFPEYCEPCINKPNISSFEFRLLATSGRVKVKLIYYNLYVAV